MIRRLVVTLSNRIHIGSFLGNVLVLAGGTGLAQLIAVLATPFLTRIYTPQEFGNLTVFVSSLALILVIVTLRYEVAIPLPANDEAAMNLTALSGLIALVIGAMAGIVIFLFGDVFVDAIGVSQVRSFLWLYPLAIVAGGGVQTLNYWHIRRRNFRGLTKAKIGQSATTVTGQLIFGFLELRQLGLVLGYFGGYLGAGSLLFIAFFRESRHFLSAVSWSGIKSAAKRYRRFPLIASWSALLNQGGLQAAPLLFAMLFGAQIAGWFGLAQRIAGIPITLIGRSVSQVYLSEASRLRNETPSAMLGLFLRTVKKLFLYVGIPMLLAGLLAPWVFAFIFGEAWRISGWYVVAMLPMFLGQITVYPLSPTLNILERQDLQLAWDVARVSAVVGVILISYYEFHLTSLLTLAMYSITMFVMYGVRFLIMWQQLHHLARSS